MSFWFLFNLTSSAIGWPSVKDNHKLDTCLFPQRLTQIHSTINGTNKNWCGSGESDYQRGTACFVMLTQDTHVVHLDKIGLVAYAACVDHDKPAYPGIGVFAVSQENHS